MKILYIKLKNFSNITTCMNCNTLEIDFSNSKNKIILFLQGFYRYDLWNWYRYCKC